MIVPMSSAAAFKVCGTLPTLASGQSRGQPLASRRWSTRLPATALAFTPPGVARDNLATRLGMGGRLPT